MIKSNETYLKVSPPRGSRRGALKQDIRKEIRRLKASYTHDELMLMSHKLCDKVINTPLWRNASTVLLYSSLPDEVNTQDLIDAAQSEKKRVLLPVVVGDDLILREFTGEYTLGAFNINEPVGPEFTDYSEIDLAIIPGMAFDYNNNRLGRGKGYYDRLLSRIIINTKYTTHHPAPQAPQVGGCLKHASADNTNGQNILNDPQFWGTGGLVGLCFPFQYIDKQDISKDSPFGGWGALGWQAEPHDIKMDFVIH